MIKKIKIGSRGSKLALLYAQKTKDTIIQNTNLNDQDIIIKKITTQGDQVKDVRLSDLGGKGLFSSNIENELKLKTEIDYKKLIEEITENSNIQLIVKGKNNEEILNLLDELIIDFKEQNNLKKIESLEKKLINNLDENSFHELIKLKNQINRE